MQNTINITPKWSSLIRPMIEVVKNPRADFENRKYMESEIIRLAKIVDDYNEKIRKQNG
jgi:hypothetical protein